MNFSPAIVAIMGENPAGPVPLAASDLSDPVYKDVKKVTARREKKRSQETARLDNETEAEWIRRRNAVYSRRSYHRKRDAYKYLQSQSNAAMDENFKLRTEYQKLTQLLEIAKNEVVKHRPLILSPPIAAPTVPPPIHQLGTLLSPRARLSQILLATQQPQGVLPVTQLNLLLSSRAQPSGLPVNFGLPLPAPPRLSPPAPTKQQTMNALVGFLRP